MIRSLEAIKSVLDEEEWQTTRQVWERMGNEGREYVSSKDVSTRRSLWLLVHKGHALCRKSQLNPVRPRMCQWKLRC